MTDDLNEPSGKSDKSIDEVHTEGGIAAAKNEVEYINSLGFQFDKMCAERHEYGQKKYGDFTFLENDIIGAMLEELADTANYCRYQAVKLMMLQNALVEELDSRNTLTPTQDQAEPEIGAKAFKGVGEVGWQ